jgi:diguanylate cyclase (GGDEF)-like protein/PAS domain S-box-containing protein
LERAGVGGSELTAYTQFAAHILARAALLRGLFFCAQGAGRRTFCQNIHTLSSILVVMTMVLAASALGHRAHALEPIVVGSGQEKVNVKLLGDLYADRGEKLAVETAAGADGVGGRMSVSARTPGTNPNWIVFALNNPTEKAVTLWLTAQRYDVVESGVASPDLDAPRITAVTPSLGFRPERVANEYADIFRLNIEPGQTITYIVELSSANFPNIFVTPPASYTSKLNNLALLHGILLGVCGVLALFLVAVFAANHKAVFPATAIVAWSVVAYLCVDFGFWNKLFKLPAEDNAIYRAAAEAAMAASIILFLYTFLRIRLWHSWIALLFLAWFAAETALIGVAAVDAKLASGLARLSYGLVAGFGTLLIAFLALRGQERALSLLPTWMLFLVWLFGAAVTIMGKISGDVVVSSLPAGLVLFVALLGFTVTQYAFHAGDPVYSDDAGQFQLQALALEASGASVWEWNTRRDEIRVGPEVDVALGYAPGALRCGVDDWLQHMHTADRERFRLILWTIRERHGGEITVDFRLRRADGGYHWFELRAHSMTQRQSRILRCAGLMRDVTAQKRAQERLMHNAVYDSLTSLPNRELFLDRVFCAITRYRSQEEGGVKPTILIVDIDTFKNVAWNVDLVVNDSILLTFARRLARHVGVLDTIARLNSEQFAILLATETEPRHIVMLAERVRRALRSPMKISGRDITLTGSIGIAVYEGQQGGHAELLKEAETAMFRAKRSGADRIELYKPEMHSDYEDRNALETELRQAVDKRQIRVFFQPIMRVADEQLAGFEAMVRWEHPKLGRLGPAEFMPMAESAGIVGQLSVYVMERALRQEARWLRTLPRVEDPLFVTINLSSRQLFREETLQELRLIIGREAVPKGCLRLEISESLIMENPEQAVEVLELFKGLGAGLSLDDFGAGYSSLSYIHRLPFDTIKVDRALVTAGSGDTAKSGAVMLRAVMAMARELGKDVVAVGVEREDDVAYLRALGCDFAQGFYYGEPMSEKAVMNLVTALARGAKRDEKRGKVAKKAAAAMDERDDDEGDASMDEAVRRADVPQNNGFTIRPTAPRSQPATAPNRMASGVESDGSTDRNPGQIWGGERRPTQTPGTAPAGGAARRAGYQADRGAIVHRDQAEQGAIVHRDALDSQPEGAETEPEGGWKTLFGMTKRRPKPDQPIG